MPTIDFASDMDNIFLDSGFEESIVYLQSDGTSNTINAIIDRDGVLLMQGGGLKGHNYKIKILISKTDINTIVTQEDTVTLSFNDTNKIYKVHAILYEDQGAYILGLA